MSKWKWIGIKLVMASTLQVGDMKNAPMIQNAASLCIFFDSLRNWYKDASLKYQSWNLYNIIGRIYIL